MNQRQKLQIEKQNNLYIFNLSTVLVDISYWLKCLKLKTINN